VTSLLPLAQQIHLVCFFDAPSTMSGKLRSRSRGLGDFDGRPLVASSTTPPIEDKLSAVSRKSNLEMLSTFLVYDECIQADHIEKIAEHLLVVLF